MPPSLPSKPLPSITHRVVSQVQMHNKCFRVIRASGGKPWNIQDGSPNVAWALHGDLETALDKAFALANWTP